MVRLPLWAQDRIEKIAALKGLPMATAIKELVCEQLNEKASATGRKQVTDAASSVPGGEPACQ